MLHQNHTKSPLLNNQDQLYYFQMQQINPKRIKYQSGRQSVNYKYHKLPQRQAQNAGKMKRSPDNQLPISKPFNPKIITMNGITFKLVSKNNHEPPAKKSNLPTMLVSCYYCHQVQSVPVTTDNFQCGTCKAVNQCQSLFDMLRCEQCNAKVLYKRGSSQLIKCTKCQKVNSVAQKGALMPQQFVQQPFYHVFHDQPLKEHKQNPYAGTLQDFQKEFELQELVSADNDDLATYMGNMDL